MEELRRHQLRAVDALLFLSKLCDKNGIRYYLLAGSCLGAVRHKGFIPWDDDIDIGIKNSDYEKLDELISKTIPSKYQWVNNVITEKYPRLFGKILDENGKTLVDVFRLIRLPKYRFQRDNIWITRRFLYKLFYRKFGMKFNDENRIVYKISKIVSACIPLKTIVNFFRWNETRYQHCLSNDYINLYSIYSQEKETIYDEWIKKTSNVFFEGYFFQTFSDPDAYLRHLYGDYMIIPPENERRKPHKNVFDNIEIEDNIKMPLL